MAKESGLTPLMKQHNDIKIRYPDAILLFRVGDFYETFGEDAVKASQILNITLTKRNNGNTDSLELAGFPFHALDNYLHKLVKAGFRVAICDQLEDPKLAKGLVKRGVTELVTPGLNTVDQALKVENNFICAIHKNHDIFGLAFLDISTADFFITEGDQQYCLGIINNLKPAEIIFNKDLKSFYTQIIPSNYFTFALDRWHFDERLAHQKLIQQFNVFSLKGFGIIESNVGVVSAAVIFQYLKETEHPHLNHLNSIRLLPRNEAMYLDSFTLKNLEIFEPSQRQGTSLFSIINKTLTPMGTRLLKNWLLFPLINIQQINQRLYTVQHLVDHNDVANAIEQKLKNLGDIERMLTKISILKIQPREFLSFAFALQKISELKQILADSKQDYFIELSKLINETNHLSQKIIETIKPDAPPNRLNGNYIIANVSSDLAQLIEISSNGKNHLKNLAQSEIEKTGISSLKVGYNKVFGYYLEVTHTHKDKVPSHWLRKQTLTNAERYTTPAIQDYEEKIVSAEEEILKLEEKIYLDLINFIIPEIAKIQQNAHLVAIIDNLINFSQLAISSNYTKPNLTENYDLYLESARHPIIEKCLPLDSTYIANTITMNSEQQIMLITGPNMSGKSALLKQTALITILAHIGCFVPASQAVIPITDKIFTRIGANDNQSAGESTFMVEMNEAAKILNNISARSLIIFDELGRGTATYDGISIAWAIVEFLQKHIYKPKTLFATHYHEISELENQLKNVKNFHISYQEVDHKIFFLRILVKGATMHSFGIHVAEMSGVPQSITKRAYQILNELEAKGQIENISAGLKNMPSKQPLVQLSLFDNHNEGLNKIKLALDMLEINSLTPVEALLKLQELKNLIS
ncbi:MAG: DNA mismatch repair protein MutS [Sediminibacterium sp.]|nr:DNA mismatch repair protein MutS [Sediminibacterium sp.]